MIWLTSWTLFLSLANLKVSFSSSKVLFYKCFSFTSNLNDWLSYSNWLSLFVIDESKSPSLFWEPLLSLLDDPFGVGMPPPIGLGLRGDCLLL